MILGWGLGPYGWVGWGVSAPSDKLILLSAEAIRENCVRLNFNQVLAYTDVRGLVDAADPENYAIEPVEGTIGEDGLPARPVFPVLVEQTTDPFVNGRSIDVWLDRRLSPYPAQYRAFARRSVAANGVPLLNESAFFFGVNWQPPTPANAIAPATDFANPGYESSAIPGSTQILGVYPTTSQGDYATDRDLVSYKKRIIRRITTRRGRFAHLPNYGVGLLDQIKQLAKPSVRQTIAAEAEAQIREEPETINVQVTITAHSTASGLFFFRVKARTKVFGDVNLDIPLETA